MANVRLVKTGGQFDAIELKRVTIHANQVVDLTAEQLKEFKEAFPNAEWETVTAAEAKAEAKKAAPEKAAEVEQK